MMVLRRSARLSATPSKAASPLLQPSTQTNKASSRASPSSKGVSKAPKAPEKKLSSKLKKTLADPLPPTAAPTAGATDGHPTSQNIWDPSSTSNTNNDSISTSRPHSTPPLLDRPVELHGTNAPLLTPHGSSVVAYPPGTEAASPSKTGRPRPTATTGTLLDQATAHLIAADPRLESVIKQHPCPLFSPAGLAEQIDPFRSLVVSIIGQQVSGAAAKSIRDKFVALFNDTNGAETGKNRFPAPEEITRLDIPTLRTAGLSQRKAEYIHGLSQKFADGELSARMLLNASDEELLQKLTAVRGLGRWSVEMFACFALKRIDVFSTGDLGVQGCAAFVGKDVNKLKAKGGGKFKYMAENDMLELAAKFAPYRSLFMWYMWRIENVDIAVLNS